MCAGDGGERPVGPALELEVVGAHRDHVLHALPLPHQPRAGQRAAVGADAAEHDVAAVELLAERLQARPRLRLQPAVGELLDAVGEPALQVGPVEGRRLLAEQLAPLLLQVGGGQRLQRGQPAEHVGGRDGGHGRATARAAPKHRIVGSCGSPFRSSHDRSGRAVCVANSLPGHGHVGRRPAPDPRPRGRAAAAARRRAGRRPRGGAAAGGGWGSERPWFAGTIGRRGRKEQRKQPLSEPARLQRQPSEAGRGAGGASDAIRLAPPSRARARLGSPDRTAGRAAKHGAAYG